MWAKLPILINSMAYDFEAALKAGTSPQQITNYLTSKGRSQEAETYFNIHPNNGESLVSKGIKGVGNYAKSVWSDYGKGAQDIWNSIDSAGKGQQNPLSAGLQTAGHVASAAFAPITEALAPAVNKAADALSNNPTFSNIANSPVGDKVASTQTAYQQWAQQHPEASKNLEATVNIGTLLAGEKPVQSIADTAAGGVSKVADVSGELAKTAAVKTGQALKSAGEAAYSVGVGMEEPTKIALQSYEASKPTLFERVKNVGSDNSTGLTKPVTEANTAARHGLSGTEWQLGVQAKRVAGDIWNKTISPALDASKDKINMPTFLSEIKADIMKTADLNRRNILLDAFNSFAQDFGKVNDFGIKKLQNYKEGWAKFVPEASYKGKPISGSLNEIRNMAASKARGILYDKLGPELKQAYLDYGNLQSIEKAGLKSVDLLRSKGVSRQVWEFVLDKAVTPVSTFAGKVLYRTGDGLEFLGNQDAKTVGDIIGRPSVGLSIKDVSAADRQVAETWQRLQDQKIKLMNQGLGENSPSVKNIIKAQNRLTKR